METIKRIFNLEDEVPYEINGVKLTEQSRDLLSKGQFSEYMEGLVFEDGSVKNGKIKFSKDAQGELEILYHFKKEKLVIPSRIGEYELSENDKSLLTQNKLAGPIPYNSQNIYLQVDPDLNSIVVKNENELSMSEIIQAKYDRFGEFKIGDVSLSENQIKDLIAGKNLPNMVYYDAKTDQHFLAQISITPDDHGIKFLNFQTISKERAHELEPLLNKKGHGIEAAVSTANEMTKENSLEKEFFAAVEKKDFNKLQELSESGYKPSEKVIENINSLDSVSPADINRIQQVFGMEVKAEKILHAETLLNSATEISNSSQLTNTREQHLIPEQKDGYLEPGNSKDPDYLVLNREQEEAQYLKEIDKAIADKDFKALNDIKEQGYTPAKDELDKRLNASALTAEEKIGVQTIFEMKPDGEVRQPHTKSVEEKSKGIQISEENQKKPIQKEGQKAHNGQKTKTAANMLEKGFSNM